MNDSKKKIIAFDYDGTITTNVEFWLDVMKRAEAAGFSVLVATMRYAHERSTMDPRVTEQCSWIITTGRKAKRDFLQRFGVEVDIWIDDQPHFVLMDAAQPSTFKHDDSGLFSVLDQLYSNPMQMKYVVIYATDPAAEILQAEFPDNELINRTGTLHHALTFNHKRRGTLIVQERFFARIAESLDWEDVHLFSTSALQPVEYELSMRLVPSALNTGITLDPNSEAS